MRNILVVLISILFINCSGDDDNGSSFDKNLLYGQWYNVGLCQNQNSLLLNENKTYTGFSSGAVDCNDPGPDTYKAEGTFELNNDFIVYSQTTVELIIDGTDITVQDIQDPNVRYEITNLTETNLVIRVFRNLDNAIVEELGTSIYEH